ncbi:MAG: hypothetical protein EXR54_06905 [Dehalococcoidia bacterium]|nr:hypothetical protein [Dehalococcoidia bacterium]MSQ17280.1 hypothetical protein [Dehalococcoidia bacterium]
MRKMDGLSDTKIGTISGRRPLFQHPARVPVSIYWLNYSGQRQLFRTLPTTAHYVQSTWATHPWVVTDLEGRCLAIYMATSQPGSATLK